MKPPRGQNLLVAISAAAALISAMTAGVRCRCGHPRHLHQHHAAGRHCACCGCRAWTLWGRRRG